MRPELGQRVVVDKIVLNCPFGCSSDSTASAVEYGSKAYVSFEYVESSAIGGTPHWARRSGTNTLVGGSEVFGMSACVNGESIQFVYGMVILMSNASELPVE